MGNGEGGAIVTVGVIALIWWTIWGGGSTTIKQWLGQDTYEDRVAALDALVTKARVGTSADVWLVKRNLGIDDRVALFFGYLDDWDTCAEFAAMYTERYPLDTYACNYAN